MAIDYPTGCNLYVLDKNYGGLLIIWDRIFGTFQAMKKGEEIVFGIVFQHQSFNPIWQMVIEFKKSELLRLYDSAGTIWETGTNSVSSPRL